MRGRKVGRCAIRLFITRTKEESKGDVDPFLMFFDTCRNTECSNGCLWTDSYRVVLREGFYKLIWKATFHPFVNHNK